MPGGRAGEPDARPVQHDVGAEGGQLVLAAIEVQQREPPGRAAEVVHPGYGLLAAVAALAETDRRLDPADLMRDRAVIGVQAEPGTPNCYPQRLMGPHSGQPGASRLQAC